MSGFNFENGSRPDDDLGFEWVDGDEELTPETRRLLDELAVPVRRTPKMSEIVHGDLVQEVQERLATLRVEGFDTVDKCQIKSAPELQMTPYILDDVHYEVYRRRKLGPFNRYISVSAKEIFDEFDQMSKTCVNGVILQRKQNKRALRTLVETAKIDEGSVYEAMTSPDGRFATRSLFRLLSEVRMRPFTNILPRAAEQRGLDGPPLMFDEVAMRALHSIDSQHRRHMSFDTTELSNDQRLAFTLILRDIERAIGFARPVGEYVYQNISDASA